MGRRRWAEVNQVERRRWGGRWFRVEEGMRWVGGGREERKRLGRREKVEESGGH